MQRRAFLRMAGLVAAACALPRLVHADDALARFDDGRARHPWLAGWQDAPACDGALRATTLEGAVPPALSGTLYRNGPGRFSRAGVRYRHWFDGDGLLQAWRIGPRGVAHQARFAGTPKFAHEERAGRFVRPAAGTHIDGAMAIRNSDDLNTANTAVVAHAGELYALWEGGSAFALDPATLETRGAKTWRDDLASVPFSAHPLIDRDGSLWNFGLSGDTLLVWHVGADGRLSSLTPVALPYAGYLHAFSMTATHLAFVLLPYVRDGDPGDRPYFETLQWQPGRGARALVLRKYALDRPQWFGLPAGAAYHFGPAFHRGDALVLQACWNGNGRELLSPFASEMQGLPRRLDGDASFAHIALDLRRGGVRFERAVESAIDFPHWHDDHGGATFALATTGANENGYFDAVCALDPGRGETARYAYGAGIMVEEHRFVPAPDARRATQGWLVGTVLDYRRGRSGLSILDAEDIGGGPLAMAWLPHTLPLGFHGWFAAG
jgi:carotenoid cleavage dioxygenase-like enzyme